MRISGGIRIISESFEVDNLKSIHTVLQTHNLSFTLSNSPQDINLCGLIDWNFNFNRFKDMHDYNTRFNNNICKPQSKRSWGQHRFVCHAVDDWNALPDGIRNISDVLVFGRLIRNM